MWIGLDYGTAKTIGGRHGGEAVRGLIVSIQIGKKQLFVIKLHELDKPIRATSLLFEFRCFLE